MMSEKNSAGIAKFFMSWLDKNVHGATSEVDTLRKLLETGIGMKGAKLWI